MYRCSPRNSFLVNEAIKLELDEIAVQKNKGLLSGVDQDGMNYDKNKYFFN